MDEQAMIQAIRKHAEANYNKGWDYVVECWADGDILEKLSDAEGNLKQAIKDIQSIINIQAEVRSSCW
jgi:hypothetical protein